MKQSRHHVRHHARHESKARRPGRISDFEFDCGFAARRLNYKIKNRGCQRLVGIPKNSVKSE